MADPYGKQVNQFGVQEDQVGAVENLGIPVNEVGAEISFGKQITKEDYVPLGTTQLPGSDGKITKTDLIRWAQEIEIMLSKIKDKAQEFLRMGRVNDYNRVQATYQAVSGKPYTFVIQQLKENPEVGAKVMKKYRFDVIDPVYEDIFGRKFSFTKPKGIVKLGVDDNIEFNAQRATPAQLAGLHEPVRTPSIDKALTKRDMKKLYSREPNKIPSSRNHSSSLNNEIGMSNVGTSSGYVFNSNQNSPFRPEEAFGEAVHSISHSSWYGIKACPICSKKLVVIKEIGVATNTYTNNQVVQQNTVNPRLVIENLVREIYREELDRDADAAGLIAWTDYGVNLMNSGFPTNDIRAKIVDRIRESQEWKMKHPATSTPSQQSSYPPTGTTTPTNQQQNVVVTYPSQQQQVTTSTSSQYPPNGSGSGSGGNGSSNQQAPPASNVNVKPKFDLFLALNDLFKMITLPNVPVPSLPKFPASSASPAPVQPHSSGTTNNYYDFELNVLKIPSITVTKTEGNTKEIKDLVTQMAKLLKDHMELAHGKQLTNGQVQQELKTATWYRPFTGDSPQEVMGNSAVLLTTLLVGAMILPSVSTAVKDIVDEWR